jgi:HEAT repeat protein
MKWLAGLVAIASALAEQQTAAQRNQACYAVRGNGSTEVIAEMRKEIEDPVLRTCAARNLREAGATAALIDALRNGDADTRVAAARELGSLGDPAALDALGIAALDENQQTAVNAITALGAYAGRDVLPYILKAAASGGVVGMAALEQAGRFHDPLVLPATRAALARGDMALQVIAMSILGDLGDSSDLPELRQIAAKGEMVSARGRGFGFLPAIDSGRAARNAAERIESRMRTGR